LLNALIHINNPPQTISEYSYTLLI